MDECEFAFDLRHDAGKGAAAVTGFVFDTVPAIRIVTCGNDDAACSVAFAHKLRNGWGWARFIAKQDRRAGGADNFGDDMGDGIGRIAMIEADDDAFACVFPANDVTRDGLRDGTRVGESEILGDDAAPSVSAKFDIRHWE